MAMATAALLLATPLFGQEERTGVSRPDPAMITTDQDVTAAPLPAMPPTGMAAPTSRTQNGETQTTWTQTTWSQTTGTGKPSAATPMPPADLDAGIVTHVYAKPGDVPEGTLMKVRLRATISTATTKVGSKFSALVVQPMMRDGRVIIPIGAVLDGQVTELKGGKRVGGRAAIHLEPKTVTLPDGSHYTLHARVIDTDQWAETRVDSEGTILRKDEPTTGTGAAFGLATGGGAAAGAVIGGLPGAVVGAGVGAGVGTVVWLKQDRQAELPKDLGLVFSLTSPMAERPVKDAAARSWGTVPRGE